jgi:hypothetical protein
VCLAVFLLLARRSSLYIEAGLLLPCQSELEQQQDPLLQGSNSMEEAVRQVGALAERTLRQGGLSDQIRLAQLSKVQAAWAA